MNNGRAVGFNTANLGTLEFITVNMANAYCKQALRRVFYSIFYRNRPAYRTARHRNTGDCWTSREEVGGGDKVDQKRSLFLSDIMDDVLFDFERVKKLAARPLDILINLRFLAHSSDPDSSSTMRVEG